MSAFDEATALTAGSGVWTARTDSRFWMQVGPFGGWSAAVALRAMTEAATSPARQLRTSQQSGAAQQDRASQQLRDAVPVALTVNFLGAILQGAVVLRPRLMKQNKSSAFWSVEASGASGEGPAQPGGTGQANISAPSLSATVLFARRRETAGYQEIAMPEVPPPAAVADLDTRGYGPVWVHSYELRHAVGMPLSSGATTRSLVWTKLRDDRPLDFIRLAAYCDASIARPFYRIPTFAPVATVTMNAYFHCEPADLERVGTGYLLIDSTARIGRRGYTDQVSTLWSEEGRLLATAEQLMWFNAPPGSTGQANDSAPA